MIKQSRAYIEVASNVCVLLCISGRPTDVVKKVIKIWVELRGRGKTYLVVFATTVIVHLDRVLRTYAYIRTDGLKCHEGNRCRSRLGLLA